MRKKTISLIIALLLFSSTSITTKASSDETIVETNLNSQVADNFPNNQGVDEDESIGIDISTDDDEEIEVEIQTDENINTKSIGEEENTITVSESDDNNRILTESSNPLENPDLEDPSDVPENTENENDVLLRSMELSLHSGELFKIETINDIFNQVNYEIIELITPIEPSLLTNEQIGKHIVKVVAMDQTGKQMDYEIIMNITGVPVISIEQISLNHGDKFEFEKLPIKATDYEDGDLTDSISLIDSNVVPGEIIDSTQTPIVTLALEVTDSDDNKTISEIEINVINDIEQTTIKNTINVTGHKTIAGSNRFKTASAISQEMYTTSDTIILVSSTNFPDALAAGPLSVSLSAPILLTDKDDLSKDTLAEIRRLGATKAIIMGGELAISNAVHDILKAENLLVERIAGSNRYKTAIAAANRLGSSSTIILTNGESFADALTAGSYAARHNYPIILTKSNTLPSEVLSHINDSVTNIIVMGGELAIEQSVLDQLKKNGRTITRIAGGNRYVTGLEMASTFFKNSEVAVIASGTNFVDALSAVPYAAALNSPILITDPKETDQRVLDYMKNSSINFYHFIGGELAVSNQVKDLIINPAFQNVVYRSKTLSGNWSETSMNGKTTGSITNDGLSLFEISLNGDKDLNIRYGVSTRNKGWQNIVESGPVGISGDSINGLIMELKGTDAVNYDISYRVYIAESGWSNWTIGGMPAGSAQGSTIKAIEAKIIKGNALKIDKALFPSQPKQNNYSYTSSSVNLRTGDGSTHPIILVIPNKSHIEVISTSSTSSWAKVNYTARDITYTGFVHTAYIRTEVHTSSTILTVNNLKNGDPLPIKEVTLNGDIAYKNGISEIRYYINGKLTGKADHGFSTASSLSHGFSYPVQTGYKITIPAASWTRGKLNTLKIEMQGMDGKIEWKTIYLNDSNDIIKYENYSGSFNFYLSTEYEKGSAVHFNSGWKPASMDQISTYMDPTNLMAHDTYKYVFLDLGYSPDDYTVSVDQLESIVKGKGVLDGMGHVFLKAAKDFNINPFYLVSHAILETGHGKSALSTGQKLEYYHARFGVIDSELIPLSLEDQTKTWYNMFGIGAYDSNPLLWGTEKAYHEKWDSIEKAIYGGAEWIASGYIDRRPERQNTNYKMRYNLKETMSHQYATDIMWAYKQASRIKAQFDEIDMDIPLKFIVPVFGDVRP